MNTLETRDNKLDLGRIVEIFGQKHPPSGWSDSLSLTSSSSSTSSSPICFPYVKLELSGLDYCFRIIADSPKLPISKYSEKKSRVLYKKATISTAN